MSGTPRIPDPSLGGRIISDEEAEANEKKANELFGDTTDQDTTTEEGPS